MEEGFPLFSKSIAFSKREAENEEIVSNGKLGLEGNKKQKRQKKGLERLSERQSEEVTWGSASYVEANNENPIDSAAKSFTDLGLSDWTILTCKELCLKRPTPVQVHCIPQILAGKDVLGLAETGSGKTAAFALPILHRLSEDPYGVFALVVTPTRELAYQLAEQFRAFGSSLRLRCSVIVGGMDALSQAQTLMQRPHVVIATPGRIKVLLEANPDIPSVFSKTRVSKLFLSFRLLIL